MCIVEPAGYEIFLLRREDQDGEPTEFIAHESFLATYHQPTTSLEKAAADIGAQLEYEGEVECEGDATMTRVAVRAATTPEQTMATLSNASDVEQQWQVRLHGETQVENWWNSRDENDATKLATTCWSLNYSQYDDVGYV